MDAIRCLAVLFLAAAPAGAQIRALPAPAAKAPLKAPAGTFVPNYINTLAVSLERQTFFAGEMLGSFDIHLAKVAPMTRPEEVAAYLQDEILGTGYSRLKPAQVVKSLGREQIEPNKAAALLLANSLARPDQFEEVLAGMERLKSAWGQRIAAAMENAEAAGGSPILLNKLRETGKKLRPNPYPGTYNAAGELDGLFDGSK